GISDHRGGRDREDAELHRIEHDLPREGIAEEPAPLREAGPSQRVVVEGAHHHEQGEGHEEEGRIRERERQHELPLPAESANSHFATSLLKRSIHAARSGLIFDQSCRTNLAISSSEVMGRSRASFTSRFTGMKLFGGCMRAVCTGALITVSKYL